jgi:predicted transcriptional regulator
MSMPEPRGKLTAVQHRIMQAVWPCGEHGATASEIWQAVCAERAVGRTTVLKQIQRLEDRRWLRRIPEEGVARYVAALQREQTSRMLAAEFVDSFFGGSLSELVLSVLDARGITAGDVQRLRQLLDDHTARRGSRRRPS